ncbi:MAG: thioredoxin domain-containing protein [Opitutae bacterium]|nr:thioredoxin domain-containing protein [Opitutae bacterium]
MPNQLSDQSSLYLKQHANQPVEWMPWTQEAFDLAKKLDKPIILSIGYSACHWCHVMSVESFEDSYIASIMNRHFVCIKVDREERPDIDQTYLEAVRMFNQSAGWPLNVFCLPDGRPFWGGTYFPKEDKGQEIVPWPQVLMRIAEHYKREKGELEENANNVVSNLLHANNALSSSENEWDNELLLSSAKSICDSHDDQEGGFTKAPKFPSPMKIDFLLSIRESQAVRLNQKLADKIDLSISTTLSKMACGGIYDQIGGGFFRYSVDAQWQIPHFEKMLYDNALLLSTYSRAYQRFRNPIFKKVVEQSIDWLCHKMADDGGSFYSSVNADSDEGEGEYYLWTYVEIEEILGKEDASKFANAYGITQEGNFEKGKSLPVRKIESEKEINLYTELETRLLNVRENKNEPDRDKKKITSWNALLIKGFVDAARAFNRKDWLKRAIDLNDWMTNNLSPTGSDISSILFENQKLSPLSFLDDFAFWAESLLNLSSISDWVEKGSSRKFIEQAEQITLSAINSFKDTEQCGFFFSKNKKNDPAQVRKKFWYDNATPSANSSLLRICSTLYELTNNESWLKEYKDARKGYPNLCKQAPHGIGHALCSITDMEVGICTITASTEQIDEILIKISQNPYRPIFVSSIENQVNDAMELKIGNKFNEKINDITKSIDMIFA